MRGGGNRLLTRAARVVAVASRVALLAGLWFALKASATTVTGTIVDGTGAPATATVTITYLSFTTAAGKPVVGGRKRFMVTAGALEVELEPNAGGNPADTSYFVRYQGSTLDATEFWVVPDQAAATVAEVRTAIQPNPSALLKLSQIPGLPASIIQSGVFDPDRIPDVGGIDCADPVELTIAAGVITVTGSACYAVDTEGDASSDDLTTINCPAGALFVLRAADSGRTVRIVDGNGVLDAQANFELDHVSDLWQGLCRSTNQVVEVSRANAR